MKSPAGSRSLLLVCWVLGIAAGCQNAGEGNVVSISGTGVVNGLVFLDRNGNRVLDASDTALPNLPLRLIARGTRDTVAKGASSSSGTFHFTAVPIGGYTMAADTTLLGDSLRLTRLDTAGLMLQPNDTINVQIAVSFPQLTIPEAREPRIRSCASSAQGLAGASAKNSCQCRKASRGRLMASSSRAKWKCASAKPG